MTGIEIEALPYDELGTLNLLVSVSSNGFGGAVEIFTTPDELISFGNDLVKFPADLEQFVAFEVGDCSGEYPFHLLFRAQTIDNVGHSAIYVHVHNLASRVEAASTEFFIPADVASINLLGNAISLWAQDPRERFSWRPSA